MPKVYAETQLVGIIGVFGIGAIVDLVSLSFLHFRLDEAFEYLQDRPEIINRVVRIFCMRHFLLCQQVLVGRAKVMTKLLRRAMNEGI